MNQAAFAFGNELIVDLFAGGGGASLGIEQAFGRPVDICVNHNADAVAMHAANHPHTKHLISDVFEVDPVEATGNRQVGLLWASPDCKHFSKAKGGKPVSKKIRGLAWVVVKWATLVKPRVIMLENVEEFVTWGPVTKEGRPCPIRKGFTFRRWIGQLQKLGYKVEYRELRACDYGAPTIRKRFFLIARCDGRPIVWPKPTHGKPDSQEVKAGKLLPYQTAADCIDFSLPCPSIFLTKEEAKPFGVKRPLAYKTMTRIYKGVKRFVMDATKPFIVRLGQTGGNGSYTNAADTPLTTITTKAEHCLVTPTLVEVAHGEESADGTKRWGRGSLEINAPLNTTTLKGNTALVSSFLTKYRGESAGSGADMPFPTITANGESKRPGGNPPIAIIATHLEQANGGGYKGEGRPVEAPVSTICGSGSHQQLVATSMIKLRGTNVGSDAGEPLHTVSAQGLHHGILTSHIAAFGQNATGSLPDEPFQTVLAGATRYAEVRAFLIKFYSEGGQHADCNDPMHTVPTKDRMGLVMVEGAPWMIADIGLRMLTPRELFRAQGFPDTYVINIGQNGKKLPKDAQVRMCGNSVCPPMAKALVEANVALIKQIDRPQVA